MLIFMQKSLLVFYTQFENSTTRIAIVDTLHWLVPQNTKKEILRFLKLRSCPGVSPHFMIGYNNGHNNIFFLIENIIKTDHFSFFEYTGKEITKSTFFLVSLWQILEYLLKSMSRSCLLNIFWWIKTKSKSDIWAQSIKKAM